MAETLRILQPGISAITDLGRRSAGSVGQMSGGALDQYSARIANVLVASPENAPLIELTALNFLAVPSTDLLISVTGAPAEVTVNDVRAEQWQPVVVPAGASLAVTGIRDGLRVYVAIHGSIRADTLMGSCAPDSVLGFGRVLGRGDDVQVDVDCPPIRHPHFDIPVFRLDAPRPKFGDCWVVPVTDGPDIADFHGTESSLFDQEFVVGNSSNHIGLRLSSSDGHALPARVATSEVLSRGVPIGAVEVPAGHELLVLHRGRGVTAGYPVLAVVTTTGLDRLGQARAGHRVQFSSVGVASAVDAHRARSRGLEELRTRVGAVFASLAIPDHSSPIHTSPALAPSPSIAPDPAFTISSALTLESA
ncbi:biotin-dependent carboxyltransferase family protein [Rhodococcus sp. G-MC3]|uniref:5-oxoprolinase subunit C family protein n=1 Tax=Rhodococcus sp. G-MC3 TaxID=3046209 RepID=UPI0024B8D17F|nr:biotin-dependent carboxyltransferase family protein [Rhodococcus sp. G-MC3]MDJ0392825.1 biotin-dependent carboxyltransferase family protein [Rhodococcus sp. G-MC3]